MQKPPEPCIKEDAAMLRCPHCRCVTMACWDMTDGCETLIECPQCGEWSEAPGMPDAETP
jgi:hypothetical protein